MAELDEKLVKAIAGRVIAAMGAGKNVPAEIHAPLGECTGDYSKFGGRKIEGAPVPGKTGENGPVAVVAGPKVVEMNAGTVLKGVVTVDRLKQIKGPVRLAKGAMLSPLAADYVMQMGLDVSSAEEGQVGGSKKAAGGAGTGGVKVTGGAEFVQKVVGSNKGYAMQNIFQLKQEMCEIGHRIWIKGFCAGNEGNHSIRIGEDRVLSTPTGISKGFLRPDQIVTVDMDGNQVDKENKHKRTSEILMHLSVYKKRADVKAVIHSHPPHATAFAVADVPIPEGIHPEAEVFLGRVPTARYFTPGDKQVGESVCALIKPDTNTVMMGNHGSVSFSTSLMDAYYKLEILDAYCRILLLTKQIGKINPLSKAQMVDLLKVKGNFGMQDSRLACAPDGCVGTDNEAFLASFPDTTVASASCDCDGGNVVKGEAAGLSPAAFEAMVKQVTDQIMAGMKK